MFFLFIAFLLGEGLCRHCPHFDRKETINDKNKYTYMDQNAIHLKSLQLKAKKHDPDKKDKAQSFHALKKYSNNYNSDQFFYNTEKNFKANKETEGDSAIAKTLNCDSMIDNQISNYTKEKSKTEFDVLTEYIKNQWRSLKSTIYNFSTLLFQNRLLLFHDDRSITAIPNDRIYSHESAFSSAKKYLPRFVNSKKRQIREIDYKNTNEDSFWTKLCDNVKEIAGEIISWINPFSSGDENDDYLYDSYIGSYDPDISDEYITDIDITTEIIEIPDDNTPPYGEDWTTLITPEEEYSTESKVGPPTRPPTPEPTLTSTPPIIIPTRTRLPVPTPLPTKTPAPPPTPSPPTPSPLPSPGIGNFILICLPDESACADDPDLGHYATVEEAEERMAENPGAPFEVRVVGDYYAVLNLSRVSNFLRIVGGPKCYVYLKDVNPNLTLSLEDVSLGASSFTVFRLDLSRSYLGFSSVNATIVNTDTRSLGHEMALSVSGKITIRNNGESPLSEGKTEINLSPSGTVELINVTSIHSSGYFVGIHIDNYSNDIDIHGGCYLEARGSRIDYWLDESQRYVNNSVIYTVMLTEIEVYGGGELSVGSRITAFNGFPITVSTTGEKRVALKLKNPTPINYSPGSMFKIDYETAGRADMSMLSDSDVYIATGNGDITSIDLGGTSFAMYGQNASAEVTMPPSVAGSVEILNENTVRPLSLELVSDGTGNVPEYIVAIPIRLVDSSMLYIGEGFEKYGSETVLRVIAESHNVGISSKSGVIPPSIQFVDGKGKKISPDDLYLRIDNSTIIYIVVGCVGSIIAIIFLLMILCMSPSGFFCGDSNNRWCGCGAEKSDEEQSSSKSFYVPRVSFTTDATSVVRFANLDSESEGSYFQYPLEV